MLHASLVNKKVVVLKPDLLDRLLQNYAQLDNDQLIWDILLYSLLVGKMLYTPPTHTYRHADTHTTYIRMHTLKSFYLSGKCQPPSSTTNTHMCMYMLQHNPPSHTTCQELNVRLFRKNTAMIKLMKEYWLCFEEYCLSLINCFFLEGNPCTSYYAVNAI